LHFAKREGYIGVDKQSWQFVPYAVWYIMASKTYSTVGYLVKFKL